MDPPACGQADDMWLGILIVVFIVGGIALAIASGGIFAFVLIFLGVVGVIVMLAGGARRDTTKDAPTGRTMSSTGGRGSTETPQDDVTTGEAHEQTGYAHTGQAHMTPDQDPPASSR
jgi:heme O synthase-like polyprenyltransferase